MKAFSCVGLLFKVGFEIERRHCKIRDIVWLIVKMWPMTVCPITS